MSDQPYDYDRQGGPGINKVLLGVGVLAIVLSVAMIVNIGISPPEKDDEFGFLLSFFLILLSVWMIRHSHKNLKLIEKDRSWRKRYDDK